MPNFNWLETAGLSWGERFPEWAYGAAQWREMGASFWEPGVRSLGLPSLHGRGAEGGWRAKCPRLFISHRQGSPDADYALRIAWIASSLDVEFWLDVVDPDLTKLGTRTSPTPEKEALATARIIEMGLLNSTHVIVLMTPRTRGTLWMPYEYGRVKEGPEDALEAGCWLHPDLDPADFADYLRLGVVTRDEAEIGGWLKRERRRWPARRCGAGWQGEEPERALPR